MFLCAKSASAASAALATAYYLLEFCKLDSTVAPPLALLIVMLMTVLVVGGLKRSAWTNCLLVVITLAGLCAFAGSVAQSDDAVLPDWMYLLPDSQGVPSLLKATALMFVAYTGYGRVATLGEEIHNPRTSIPKAIITTLLASLLLYVLVALAVTAIADRIHNDQPEARSLAGLAAGRASPVTVVVITTGAVTAMLGVLLNLLLGLSRVVLAMARREDMPGMFSKLNSNQTTPFAAVILVGAIVAGLLLLKDARATWSLSAFTVLLYYSLTNLAALRLEQCDRLYPRWISVLGLVGCLMLAFFVDLRSIVMGAAILLAGLLWQTLTSPQVRRPLSDGKAD
jgi:APA family basic amino acid/polyamine antiporter